MKPPGLVPTTEPARGIESCESEPDLSTQNGRQRYLMAELGVTVIQAHHLLRAHERDRRDPLPLSVNITVAEVRELMAEDFRRWVARKKSKLSACDQRIGGPNWRTAS